LFEHDLFGKPLHTFPNHALALEGEAMLGKYMLWAGVLAVLISSLLGAPPKSNPGYSASRLAKPETQRAQLKRLQ